MGNILAGPAVFLMELCFGQETLPGPLGRALLILLDGFLESVSDACSAILQLPDPYSSLLLKAPLPCLPWLFHCVTPALPAPLHTWGKQTWLGLCEIKGVQSGEKNRKQGFGRSICYERYQGICIFLYFNHF